MKTFIEVNYITTMQQVYLQTILFTAAIYLRSLGYRQEQSDGDKGIEGGELRDKNRGMRTEG